MEYTKEGLFKWLQSELWDLVKDVEKVNKSDMPLFNKGLDRVCAVDTKATRLIERMAVSDMHEALKYIIRELDKAGRIKADSIFMLMPQKAIAKAEGK